MTKAIHRYYRYVFKYRLFDTPFLEILIDQKYQICPIFQYKDDGSYLPQMVVICHKSMSTLLANDITPRVYKKLHCDLRSPLMKTPDWSVKTLGRGCNSTDSF